ncbi:MAG: rod shape-determining protein RodA [Synergistaceae bacterium]|nr:rod shape-determining protein RodA [Synergistaceae bacterium]
MEVRPISVFNLKEDAALIDKMLVSCVLLLSLWGIACIYSAGAGSALNGWDLCLRQAGWLLISCFVVLIVLAVGHGVLLDAAYYLFLITLIILLITPLIAPRVKGAHSWIAIAGFRIQPSEFAKITLILALAKFLSRCPPFNFKNFLAGLGVVLVPVLLVMLQPDAGSALVYLIIAFGMFFAAGTPLIYLGSLIGSGLAALPFLIMFVLKDYQRNRLLVFIDPMRDPLGAGYNVIQSRIAVGSGGFWGKGFMNGMQSKLRFLPEPHTDFIFSVCSEEFVFIGALLLLILCLFLFYRIINVGIKSRDRRCKILTAGIATWIWAQMFESIGMSIGLMPVTGLPLPFLSYGGSSLLSVSIAIGLAISVHIESLKRPYF